MCGLLLLLLCVPSRAFRRCELPSGVVYDEELYETSGEGAWSCAPGRYLLGATTSFCFEDAWLPAAPDCIVCGKGYKTGTNTDTECDTCPIYTEAEGPLADDHDMLSDCTCVPGTEKSFAEDCTVCEQGEIAPFELKECMPCEGEMTTLPSMTPGAHDELSDCMCAPGFHSNDGRECAPCPVNTYKDWYGDESCTECPGGSSNPLTGQSSVSACVCPAAHYLGPEECTVCPLGTYQRDANTLEYCTSCPPFTTTLCTEPECHDGENDCVCDRGVYSAAESVCTVCAANYYKDAVGPMSCTECPGNSVTVGGAVSQHNDLTDCRCPPGYTGADGSTCTICPVNSYKYLHGASACQSCHVRAQSPEGSTAKSNCQCNAGYTGSGLVCNACGANQYKTVVGNSACLFCDADAQSPAASTAATDCRCNAGYSGEGSSTCAPCSADYYKNVVGDGLCTPCPSNAESPEGSVACVCKAGYSGNGVTCTECALGFFKPAAGNSNCLQCHVYATTVATASTVSASCLCNAGYSGNGITACVACPPGSYKDFLGPAGCSSCHGDATSPGGGLSSGCQCNAGYTGDGVTTCTICPDNTYKVGLGSGACSLCHPQATSPPGSQAPSACQCNPGWIGPGTTCTECLEDSYKAGLGPGPCVSCPTNARSNAGSDDVSDCQCDLGYTPSGGSGCAACTEGTYKPAVGPVGCTACPENSNGPPAATSSTQCQCDAGYIASSSADVACAICPANTYEAGTVCVSCVSNAQSPEGSSDSAACVCKAGYTLNGLACDFCPRGTYKAAPGPAACVRCANHTLVGSPNGATSAAQCVCDPGYSGDGAIQCSVCSGSTYKTSSGNTACVACPSYESIDSVMPEDHDHPDDCQCVSGYARDTDGFCQPDCSAEPGCTAGTCSSPSTCECRAGYVGGSGAGGGGCNYQPVFASTMPPAAYEEVEWTFTVVVIDLDDAVDPVMVTSPSDASFSVGGSNDGVVSWTPPAGVLSADFLFSASDDGALGSLPAWLAFTLNVTTVNNAIVISAPSSANIAEDAVDVLIAAGTTITDEDAGSGIITVTITASVGTVTAGASGPSVSMDCPISGCQAALNAMTYTPPSEYSGTAAVVIVVSDNGNTGDIGGTTSDTATITVTVNPVNDGTVLTPLGPLTVSTLEDTPVVTPGIGVVDVDSVTVTLAVTVTGGELEYGVALFTVESTNLLIGAPTELSKALASITFVPALEFSGPATVSIVADDGGASVLLTFSVEAVDDPPLLSAVVALMLVEDDGPGSLGISLDDIDSPYLYANFSGPPGIVLATSSATLGDTLVTMDGPKTTFVPLMESVVVVPKKNYFTTTPDVLTICVWDSENTVCVDVQIIVTSVNDFPTITWTLGQPVVLAATEDVPLTVNGFSVADVDGATGALSIDFPQGTITLATSTGLAFSGGADASSSMVITGSYAALSAATSTLILQGNMNANGDSTLSLALSDAGLSGSGGERQTMVAIPVTFAAVNDPPFGRVIGPSSSYSLPEDNNITFANLEFGDADDDGSESLTLAVTVSCSYGTLSIVFGGATVTRRRFLTVINSINTLNLMSVEYYPDRDFDGTDVITFHTDDMGKTGSPGPLVGEYNVTVVMEPANDRLVVTNAPFLAATTNVQWNYQVAWVDPDNDIGTGVFFDLVAGPPGMTVTAEGLVEWLPPFGQDTSGSCTLVVGDTLAEDTVITWTITVDLVNSPPIITSTPPLLVNEGELYVYAAVVEDEDDDVATMITYTVDSSQPGVLNTLGTVTWDVPVGAPVLVSITLTAADGGESDAPPAVQTFALVVNARPEINSLEYGLDENLVGVGGVLDYSDRNLPRDTLTWTVHTTSCYLDSSKLPVFFLTAPFNFEGGPSLANCSFEVSVQDENGLDNTYHITLQSEDVPDLPVATPVVERIGAERIGASVAVTLTGMDEDIGGLAGVYIRLVDVHPFLSVLHGVDGREAAGGDHVLDGSLAVTASTRGTYAAVFPFCLDDLTNLTGCANVSFDVDAPCLDALRGHLQEDGRCSRCPFGTRGGAGKVPCVPCSAGRYYVSARTARAPADPCHPCPPGGQCDGGGAAPRAAPGYWVATEAKEEDLAPGGHGFVACVPSEVCLGASECREGHYDSRCAQCKSGWYKDKVKQLCDKCPPYTLIVISVSLVLMAILCVVLVKLSTKSTRYFASFSVGFNFLQIVAILASFDLYWPGEVLSLFRVLGLLNIDIRLLRAECAIDVGGNQYFFVWLLKLFFPVLFFLMFAVGYALIHAYTMLARSYGTDGKLAKYLPDISSVHLLIVRRQFLNAYLSVLVYMYLIVTATALDVYPCTDVGSGVRTLNAEPAIVCGSPRWNTMVAVSVLVLVFFSAGFPLLLVRLLRRRRDKLHLEKNVIAYGLLFRRYKAELYLFEVAILIRKLGIVLGKVLFAATPIGQASVALFTVIVAAGAQKALLPYRQRRVNFLEEFHLACAMVVLVAGIVFGSMREKLSTTARDGLSSTVIVVVVLGCVAMFLAIAVEVHHQWKLSRRGVTGRYASDQLDVTDDFFKKDMFIVKQQRAVDSGVTTFSVILRSGAPLCLQAILTYEQALRRQHGQDAESAMTGDKGAPPSLELPKVAQKRRGTRMNVRGSFLKKNKGERQEGATVVQSSDNHLHYIHTIVDRPGRYVLSVSALDAEGGTGMEMTDMEVSLKDAGEEDPERQEAFKLVDLFVSMETGSHHVPFAQIHPIMAKQRGVLISPIFRRLLAENTYTVSVKCKSAGTVVLSQARPSEEFVDTGELGSIRATSVREGVVFYRGDDDLTAEFTPREEGPVSVWARFPDEEALSKGRVEYGEFEQLATFNVIKAQVVKVLNMAWLEAGGKVENPTYYYQEQGDLRCAIKAPDGPVDYILAAEKPTLEARESHPGKLKEEDNQVFAVHLNATVEGELTLWGKWGKEARSQGVVPIARLCIVSPGDERLKVDDDNDRRRY